MARVCDLCHRGSKTFLSRSHSNIATKVRKQVNLQSRTIKGQSLTVCSRCLKNAVKEKA